jgi:hypothetical protein
MMVVRFASRPIEALLFVNEIIIMEGLLLNLRHIVEPTLGRAGNLLANIIGAEPFASVSFNTRYI